MEPYSWEALCDLHGVDPKNPKVKKITIEVNPGQEPIIHVWRDGPPTN